jgi:hypothetical protein
MIKTHDTIKQRIDKKNRTLVKNEIAIAIPLKAIIPSIIAMTKNNADHINNMFPSSSHMAI